MIRAFFWHLREGDIVSFKLRRKRGVVSHFLTVLQPQSCYVEDRHRHCYCYYLCSKRKDWSFCFSNKTNKDYTVLGGYLFWREDFGVGILSREQCLHAAPGEALKFWREDVSISVVRLKASQFPVPVYGFGFCSSRKIPKMWGVAPPDFRHTGHSSCVWPLLFPWDEKHAKICSSYLSN